MDGQNDEIWPVINAFIKAYKDHPADEWSFRYELFNYKSNSRFEDGLVIKYEYSLNSMESTYVINGIAYSMMLKGKNIFNIGRKCFVI